MSFPPPFRFLVPVLLLAFGLAVTWLDYRANLSADLRRNFDEVVAQADVSGARLVKMARQQLLRGDVTALRENLALWKDEPWLRIAAVTDEKGVIIADSDNAWSGKAAKTTPAAPALRMMKMSDGQPLEKVTRHGSELNVSGASPVSPGEPGSAWVLVVFDRTDSMSLARADALKQLAWSGSAVGGLCCMMWAVLHFGVAARLSRLADTVREIGEGGAREIVPLAGGDEVHELSSAFALMSRQLARRERERAELERQLVDTTERERRRIGHELHDGIGQQLTAALLAGNAMGDHLHACAPALVPQAESLGVQLRQAIADVRALSHGLAPVPLWAHGLQHALQSLAESTAQTAGVRCVFECPEPVEVADEETAGNLYRIAQEAVTNALKHASAGEIRIALERRGNEVLLEVDDDGEGLPENKEGNEGIGLRVMRQRAGILGGKLTVGAAPAGGTRVAVHVPLRP
ncbi:MAG: sensor histidine kinase [Verrucomicrobiaceae bacterium]|nr:sensor histidine kinase [Verrucomicrobiaceae bacterium]